jgi:uncharacterized protein (DUF2132 family)
MTDENTKPKVIKPKDPLHGLTLEFILRKIVDRYGWEELGCQVEIRCFIIDPTIDSSLKFLRRTPWARKKVEEIYLEYLEERKRKKAKDEARVAGRVEDDES